jgi:hypothetical protein
MAHIKLNKYMLIFPNPHDSYNNLHVGLIEESDQAARKKANEILDIWYGESREAISKTILKLYRMKEIKL